MAQTGCEVKGGLRRLEGVQARGTQARALSPGACPGPGEGLHPVSQGTDPQAQDNVSPSWGQGEHPTSTRRSPRTGPCRTQSSSTHGG